MSVLFCFVILLSVLWSTTSDYPFGIFKLILNTLLHPVFSGVGFSRSLVFYVVVCRSLFVFLYFLFWPLFTLSVLWFLVITLWYLQTYLKHIDTPNVFSEIHVAHSLIFCVVFSNFLLVLLSVLFWPLYCLSFELFWLPSGIFKLTCTCILTALTLPVFVLIDLQFSAKCFAILCLYSCFFCIILSGILRFTSSDTIYGFLLPLRYLRASLSRNNLNAYIYITHLKTLEK